MVSLSCDSIRLSPSQMFRQRTSSQKPGDELLANFRQQFPEITTVTSATAPVAPAPDIISPENSVLVPPAPERSHPPGQQDVFRDQDPTPRASGTEWRFTPSLLDPSSFSFNAFANQPPGYYTPTSGGSNTIYHPQAGDLHTPSMALGMGLATPLSLPTTEGPIHGAPAMMDLSQFHHGMPPHQFSQQFNPFLQPTPPQPAFAPSSFVHHDTGYETMDHDGSPLDSDGREERMGSMDAPLHSQSPPNMMGFQHRQFGMPLAHGLPPSAHKFRFHSTLNAPTAMIRHADEIPVTYLNKGQAYSLSVVDTASTVPIVPGTRYRTFVRISFEDDQQRQKPGVCWSLWKEGRGTNEAHQRGGKLQAVEYVEAGQPAEGDDKRTRVELESASFDGFSVIWTPGINGAAECSVAVRFNFLSTDFSHSKGVKGIPVRLCAKTTALTSAESSSPPDTTAPEICYCKVKLFRDHGAERKLSNDVAHVKKTIEKLKQQIAQAENGGKDFGKRKRGGGSHAKGQDHQRPGKAQKHKRTWSMSSASSGGGGSGTRPSLEDDLHFKLQTLQDMFTSTRPVSVLYLRGGDLDDPDLHPVSLPGEPIDLAKVESKDGVAWQVRSGRNSVTGSSLVSPSPSSMSLQSQPANAAQWSDYHSGAEPSNARRASDQPKKVPKTDDAGNLSGWIEALGVDPSYKPPTEKPAKPIACFYIARRQKGDTDKRELHRAIYLSQRTVSEFVSRVSAKWAIDATAVVRVVHILESGLEVEVDDDVVHALAEGQDMILEVAEVDRSVPQPKREWETMALDAPQGDRNSAISAFRTTTGYELRLTF